MILIGYYLLLPALQVRESVWSSQSLFNLSSWGKRNE